MGRLAIFLVIPLAACQTVGLPQDAKFPPVPDDIELCAKSSLVAIPDRDLSAHDVEIMWKADRYVAVTKGRCLNRLIIRDRKLAGR